MYGDSIGCSCGIEFCRCSLCAKSDTSSSCVAMVANPSRSVRRESAGRISGEDLDFLLFDTRQLQNVDSCKCLPAAKT